MTARACPLLNEGADREVRRGRVGQIQVAEYAARENHLSGRRIARGCTDMRRCDYARHCLREVEIQRGSKRGLRRVERIEQRRLSACQCGRAIVELAVYADVLAVLRVDRYRTLRRENRDARFVVRVRSKRAVCGTVTDEFAAPVRTRIGTSWLRSLPTIM